MCVGGMDFSNRYIREEHDMQILKTWFKWGMCTLFIICVVGIILSIIF